MTVKTQKEIDDLKAEWCRDPCWDLEDTKGFEDYREELKAYSDSVKEQWNLQHYRAVKNQMWTWHVSYGSLKNTAYHFTEQLMRLQDTVQELQQSQDALQRRVQSLEQHMQFPV